MIRPTKNHLMLWCCLFALVLLTGCSISSTSGDLIAIPATGAAANTPSAVESNPAVEPPPAAAPAEAPQAQAPSFDPDTGLTDDALVLESLGEIDGSICAQALAVREELAAMKAAGEDVADLEQAVLELLGELESCQP